MAAAAPDYDLRDDETAWQNRPAVHADVSRYSRFVRTMKIVLPALATLLLALLFMYSYIGRGNETVTVSMTALGAVEDDKQMVKPRLTGSDGKGHPFTVTASAVGQEMGEKPSMTLFDVEADLTMQGGNWVKIEAKSGYLDGKAKKMSLKGAINIFSDLGYECHTEAAIYDIGQGILTGKEAIVCQGPLGVIKGNGFEGLRKAEQLSLSGGVKTTFYPPPRKRKPAAAQETPNP
jgi:lipopolysaccharide export system protein LptC